jgi:hypothetical protein
MAEIIEFRSFDPGRVRKRERPVEDAEILFFTGVRYERASEAVPPIDDPRDTSSGARRSRKRRA